MKVLYYVLSVSSKFYVLSNNMLFNNFPITFTIINGIHISEETIIL